MKSFTRFICTLAGAAVISSQAAQAGGGAAPTNSTPAGTNAASTGLSLDDLLPDVAVARGKGFEIKRSQFDRALIDKRTRAAVARVQVAPGQLETEALDYLILVKILGTKATDADKAAGKEEADKNFELLKKRAPSEETWDRQLKTVGLTSEMLRNGLAEESTARMVLRSKVSVSDDEVKKYYDNNPTDFDLPEMAQVSHMLFLINDPRTDLPLSDEKQQAKKKQADDSLKRARAGEDFTKLAMELSEDSAVKEDKGELKLYRGMQGIPPEFESAAFNLQTNQISDVVTSKLGYHIIKLIEKTPAHRATLAETSPKIKEFLQSQQINKMLPGYLVELKKEANVEILDDKLKTLEDAEAEMATKMDAIKDAKPKDGGK